jgi:hypothetical protein
VAERLTDAGICLETVYEEHGSVNLTCRRGRAYLNHAIKESGETSDFMIFCWEMHYYRHPLSTARLRRDILEAIDSASRENTEEGGAGST